MAEHAPKTYLHESIGDEVANPLLANFNKRAKEENATALPMRNAVASILIEGIHSGGGKNSCIALIDAGQHALRKKSVKIHENAKVWNFLAVAIRSISTDNTARAHCRDTAPPKRSIRNPRTSLPTARAT
jgi:hypothetical protein